MMSLTRTAVAATPETRSALATWQIDPAHSSAHFAVRHMMVANVRGEFSRVTGTVVLEPSNPATARAEAVIDAAGIQTREPARDQHLRSADFLDVERFPTITYRSLEVQTREDGGFQVAGELTLHGVTRPVTLAVEPPSAETRDPYGSIRVGTSASAKIDRRDFGLTWNAVLEAGGVLVGNEIRITLDVELIRSAA
jgi:polyisoprenoid-binding protein YceI